MRPSRGAVALGFLARGAASREWRGGAASLWRAVPAMTVLLPAIFVVPAFLLALAVRVADGRLSGVSAGSTAGP